MRAAPTPAPSEASKRTFAARDNRRSLRDVATGDPIRKTISIVFADVTGSTSLGEQLDPEAIQGLMASYFGEMREVIERHGGTVEKFIGDAVMAAFGIPVVHEDDALRAVRAASEMRERLRVVNESIERNQGVTIQVRTGVNTGEVVTGSDDMDTIAVGDPVNVAARLEQAAAPMEILMGDATYRLVRDAVAAEDAGALDLKGKADSVRAWRLIGVVPDAAGVARRLDAPIVGREREIGELRSEFDRVATERTCRLVTVLGEAGVGKSRLTGEFVAGLADHATIIRGRCLPYGDGITFWPIAEAVKQAASVTTEDDADVALAKIERLLGDEPNARSIADHVAAAIGLEDVAYPVEETFWAVRRLFEALASERPLVAVFDDIHWAEVNFLDLVEYLAGFSSASPILLLCAARLDLLDVRSTWGSGAANVGSVRLDRLTSEESNLVIRNILVGAELDEPTRARIADVAQGNPLFVEEILRMLIDEGVLRKRDGRWTHVGVVSEIALPTTIHTLLDARLEAIPPPERAVLQRASVVGATFSWAAVSALSPDDDRATVGTLLQALVRRGLIHPEPAADGEDAFAFGHILIRDAAYRGLPKQARSDLHRRFASWLTSRVGDRVGEYEEIVAYHFERAYRYRSELGRIGADDVVLRDEAAKHLASAGARASDRTDVPAMINLFGRAVGLLPPDDPRRLAMMPDLGAALFEAGRAEEATAVLSEALERADAAGDERLRAHAAMGRALVSVEIDNDELRREAELALEVFAKVGDERGLSRAHRLIGMIEFQTGRVASEEREIERALQHARNADDPREQAEIFFLLSRDLVRGPTPVDQGIERCEQVLAEAGDNRTIAGYMFHALAHLRARRGEFDNALGFADRFRATLRENGQTVAYWFFAEVPWDIHTLAGEQERAFSVLSEGVERLDELGAPDPIIGVFLGQTLYELGRLDEARSRAETGIASEASIIGGLARTLLGKVLAREGAFEEAEAIAREGTAYYEGTEFLIDHATSLTDMAEVLRLAGRDEEASSTLRRAVALFEQKGDVVSSGRMKRTLSDP
jgi:class 3 adenylate cyclase/tetratricopeptide (TPR) repeat protein